MTGSAAAPSTCTLSAVLRQELDTLAAAGLQRRHRILESPCGREVQVAGQKLINFASNDYLGLAAHPALATALAEGAQCWGAGSGAAHLLSGHLTPHAELEAALADFTPGRLPSAAATSPTWLSHLPWPGAVPPCLPTNSAAPP